MHSIINNIPLKEQLKQWIIEDMPYGDITSDSIFTSDYLGEGSIIAKEEGILCGVDIFDMVYDLIDSDVTMTRFFNDGDKLSVGDVIATVQGPVASILKGERISLNIVQRLSGIATKASLYAEQVRGTKAKIVDTRKTTPGLRYLEKYAVRTGGCTNHRFSLSDTVMIKDNHIAGAGSIQKAVELVRKNIPYTSKVEIEIENIFELQEALKTDIDIIMLDNMTLEEMKESVLYIKKSLKPQLIIEASGNMTLDRIADVARTGVDIISVGELTHSVKGLDISLKFKK